MEHRLSIPYHFQFHHRHLLWHNFMRYRLEHQWYPDLWFLKLIHCCKFLPSHLNRHRYIEMHSINRRLQSSHCVSLLILNSKFILKLIILIGGHIFTLVKSEFSVYRIGLFRVSTVFVIKSVKFCIATNLKDVNHIWTQLLCG